MNNQNTPNKLTFERTTILVAVLGLLGNFIGNIIQGANAQKLKQQEFEANLITKAIETGNSDSSKKNLKFLLDAGLIKDSEGNIGKIVSDTTYRIPTSNLYSQNAYICTNTNSTTYHKRLGCIALQQCQDSIAIVSIEEAISIYDRRRCKFCY